MIRSTRSETVRQKAVWGPDPSRRKAVWNPKGILALASLLVFGMAANATADQSNSHSDRTPRVQAGRANSQVQNDRVDEETRRHASPGAQLTLIVTQVSGQDLPKRFKKYARFARFRIINRHQV